jgi:hypothetical protein
VENWPLQPAVTGKYHKAKGFLMVHTVPTGDNQDKPYLCDCGATFGTATELNQHNQQAHGQGVAESATATKE